MANSFSSRREYPIKFSFDTVIYPKEALISAAFMFLDKYYIFLKSVAGGKAEVMIKGKSGKKLSKGKMAKIKDDFLNELLYNTARLDTARRNKRVREFIVGRALFSAVETMGPADEDDEDDEIGITDDPLNIAIPWEEKNESKKGK